MSCLNKYHCLEIVLVILLASFSWGPTRPAKASELVISPELQLGMAGMFLAEGENYRAVTEYKKFLYLFPESPELDQAMFNMGRAFMGGEDYPAAITAFEAMEPTDSQYAAESRYLTGICYWKTGDSYSAEKELARLVESDGNYAVVPNAIVAQALISFDGDQSDRSRALLNDLLTKFPNSPAGEKVPVALEMINAYELKPRKSPGLAASMSAMLPGSGYFYAGRPGDGVSAFVINGLFIAGLAEAIDRENDGLAILAAGFGLPFYVGNIYGSANAARKWNLSLRKESREDISLVLGFEF